jgi:hypothetical protein
MKKARETGTMSLGECGVVCYEEWQQVRNHRQVTGSLFGTPEVEGRMLSFNVSKKRSVDVFGIS